jgi:translation initiation factor 3 subunit D
MVMREDDGKYVLVKDPNKPTIRLYQVPADTFEEDEEADNMGGIDEQDE